MSISRFFFFASGFWVEGKCGIALLTPQNQERRRSQLPQLFVSHHSQVSLGNKTMVMDAFKILSSSEEAREHWQHLQDFTKSLLDMLV